MKEEDKFILIVRGSIYAYLKEKYPDYDVNENSQKEDIKKITTLLSKIEKYAYIPDKRRIIEENYVTLKAFMLNADFREGKLLESIQKKIEGFTEEEKEEVLNSIIYVMRDDLKISDTEKEIVIQLSKFLGINSDFQTLIKNYKKTKFKRPVRKRFKALFAFLTLLLVSGAVFFYIQKANEVKLFDEEKIAFSEVYFNRFVIYKNKFDAGGDHFKKMGVFYLSGSAEINIEPKNLKYDFVTKTVTYLMPKDNNFLVEVKFNHTEMIDEIEPTPLSKEEVKAISAVVGVAGAAIGAKVGTSMGSLVPLPFGLGKRFAAAIGAVAGGTAMFAVTSKALKGASLKKKITQKEKEIVIDSAENLLKIVLSKDENLVKMYKKDFEKYIISKYATYGYEVKTVNYKEAK